MKRISNWNTLIKHFFLCSLLAPHLLFAQENLPENQRRPKLGHSRDAVSEPEILPDADADFAPLTTPGTPGTSSRTRRRYPVLTSSSSTPLKLKFSGNFGLQYAEHTTAPNTPASERGSLFLEQRAELGTHWAGVISGQGWFEGAYVNDSPPNSTAQDDYDLRFQSTFLEYKSDNFILRAGNQQVIWGETFGSFVADIVNPKDLRYGYPLDLSQIQIATPMLNLRYLSGHFSAQALYLPQAYFNYLPGIGTDYSPISVNGVTGFSTLTVNRQTQLGFGSSSEFGLRLSQTLGAVDLSLFGMSYYDRNPYYTFTKTPVLGGPLALNEQHAQVGSVGQSFAWAWDDLGMTIREESLYTVNRYETILDQNNNLAQLITNEAAFAVSIEHPWRRFSFSLQWSVSHLSDYANYIARSTQDEQFIGQRTSLKLFSSSSVDSILSISAIDSGVRYQLEFMTPLASWLEMRLGTEIYTGLSTSDFGETQRASRAYLSLKGFFHG